MIIRLMGADFSENNIGVLNKWYIKNQTSGMTLTLSASSIDKTDTTTAITGTLTVKSGYTLTEAVKITMDDVDKTSWYDSSTGAITIPAGSITDDVYITGKAINENDDSEAYWVGEKLSGKAHGTGTASSYLGVQYYYVTDEAAIGKLSGRTVDKMAFNFASKSGADTPTGTISIYLVNLDDTTPNNWELKAEIPVESYPAGSQKEFDITPFTVPTGYTIGYRASKQAILGGGYMMQDYKIGGAYYETADATSKDAGLGGVDIHIQGT